MTGREVIKMLGLDLDIKQIEKKGETFSLLQSKRKARYHCFTMKTNADGGNNETDVPEKLIEFFEAKPEFEGWAGFGETWDIKSTNPLEIFFRDFSINQEWDATMRRVVPELPVDRILRQKGPETNK